MNFATLSYAIFLAVVVLIYWLIPRRAGRYWLIVASLVFYGSWNPIYVPGFVGLLLANWGLGFVAAGPHRRLAVGVAVLVDLGVLGLFKYSDWLLRSGTSVFGWLLGRDVDFGALGLILPLAISFVTFTMLAYVIDIGRGTSRPERSLGRFALFVLFFPHLISGPIMRAREFLPQVRHPRPFAMEHVRRGPPVARLGPAQEGHRGQPRAGRGRRVRPPRPVLDGRALDRRPRLRLPDPPRLQRLHGHGSAARPG